MIGVVEVQHFFIVLMAIVGFICGVGGVIKLFTDFRKNSRIEAHENKLNEHEKRIAKLEQNSTKQDEFTRVLCDALSALIGHELNGDKGRARLEDAQKKLTDYLINRK